MDETTITRITECAAGYAELGMFAEAADEIASLPEEFRDLPHVIRIRLLLAIKAQDWPQGAALGRRLVESGSHCVSDYIQTAYCLHELKRTEEARSVLLKAPSQARSNHIYLYNLACYEAVLGHEQSALDYLDQAAAINTSVRQMAIHDPDLASIHKYLL